MATKKLQGAFRKYQKAIFAFIFTLVLSVLTYLSMQYKALDFFEQKLIDFRFQSFNRPIKPSQDVIFANIDDVSLDSLSKDWGAWPWPRGMVMSDRIANFIAEGQPKGIFYDILYTTYSPKLPGEELPEEDATMAMYAADHRFISHAVQFTAQNENSKYPDLNPVTEITFQVPVTFGKNAVRFPIGADPLIPFSELTEYSQSLNHVNEDADDDGVSRKYTLFMEYKGKFYPSMAIKALMFARGASNWHVEGKQLFYTLPDGTKHIIPLTDDGRFNTMYYSNLDNFINLPADIIVQSYQAYEKGSPESSRVKQSTFKDKIIVIGATATGLKDLKISPVGTNYGGPFLHTTVISNLLSEHYLTQVPMWVGFGIILISILFIVLSSTLIQNSTLRSLLGFVWLALLLVAAVLGFYLYGIIFDLANTLVAGILALVGSIIFLSLTEGAEKKYIRSAFSTYLSPDVIKQLENDPDKLKLGGEKRLMTAMFTDVKGFSTFSEKLDPNDLVHLLNEYLGAMSDIVLDNEGTIDKYEGDAIIAFWGAPLDQPDHALRALRSAVAMRRCEAELNVRLIADGTAPSPLYTRFGINSGDMTVGNMGTQRRMNYTIMGNHVNLAARLEGVNKEYGTWILTSQATHDLAGDAFLMRGLDKVRVVGIKTPVRLFEVMEEASLATDTQREAVALFEAAIEHYEGQRWKECRSLLESVLKLLPGDGPASTFMKRAVAYEKDPPPQGWDGVFSLMSK